MYGPYPVDVRLAAGFRLDGIGHVGQCGLGVDEVDGRKKHVGVDELGHMGPDKLGEVGKDAYYLASLFGFELPHPVVGLHHFGRFDVDCLSGGRLVVHNTAYLAFQAGRNRYDQASVAHGGAGVAVDEALALGCPQDAVECARNAAFGPGQFAAYLEKRRRCAVFYLPELVENLVDALHYLRKRGHTVGQPVQGGVGVCRLSVAVGSIGAVEETHNGADGL